MPRVVERRARGQQSGFEIFCDVEALPWLEPSRRRTDTAVVLGVRVAVTL